MLASDAAPLFALHVRPGAFHPISRRRLAKEPVVLNHEGGSSAAMAVDGGRRSWRKTSAKDEGDGRKRQENGSMDPYARFHPLFILPCKWQPIERGASCPHRALRIPRRRQAGPCPAHQLALDGEVVVQWCRNGIPAHPGCAVSRRFGERGHDYLGLRDSHQAVTAHAELRRVMVPRASQRPREL
jgi:hypothetical protein